MNTLKTSSKAVSRLAIAAVVATLFAVPQSQADSLAGSAASTETGGPQQTQSTSSATTQSTTNSGGAGASRSTSTAVTQNSSTSSTSNTSNSGDGPVGQALSRRTVVNTGVQVKTTQPARRRVVTSKTTVKKPSKWKTVKYDYRTGSKVVKTTVR